MRGSMNKEEPDKPDHARIPSLDDTELWPDDSGGEAHEDVPAGLLSEEQQVFVELVEDILQSVEGLTYHRLIGNEQVGGGEDEIDDDTFAVFALEANPDYDLEVSIELAEREFRIHLNDITFLHRIDEAGLKRPDRWLEKRCLDVEHLVAGDLKLEMETLLGKPVCSTLYAGHDSSWRQIGHRDEGWGWTSLLSWLLPLGLSISQTDNEFYMNWYTAGEGDAGQNDPDAES